MPCGDGSPSTGFRSLPFAPHLSCTARDPDPLKGEHAERLAHSAVGRKKGEQIFVRGSRQNGFLGSGGRHHQPWQHVVAFSVSASAEGKRKQGRGVICGLHVPCGCHLRSH